MSSPVSGNGSIDPGVLAFLQELQLLQQTQVEDTKQARQVAEANAEALKTISGQSSSVSEGPVAASSQPVAPPKVDEGASVRQSLRHLRNVDRIGG